MPEVIEMMDDDDELTALVTTRPGGKTHVEEEERPQTGVAAWLVRDEV